MSNFYVVREEEYGDDFATYSSEDYFGPYSTANEAYDELDKHQVEQPYKKFYVKRV